MKTIKARHKLVPAIIMLIVAAITMSTASYAWFTMSNRVEVTGINLEVVAPTNILIREKDKGAAFANSVALDSTSLGFGKLMHASSTKGLKFFTISETDAREADPGTGALSGTPTLIPATTSAADDVDGYYVDFQLELVNTGGVPVNIGLDKLEITGLTTSAADSLDIINAVRIAILDEGKNDNLATADSIFAKDLTSAFAYSDVNNTVPITPIASQTTTALLTREADGVAKTDAPEKTQTITVRVWIEGQDADCKTANAGASFNIEFELVVIDVID